MGFVSPESALAGVTFEPQIEQLQLIWTDTPANGLSRVPLSSTARDLIVAVGRP
jgi:hypothetical protein